ncbi:MAG: DNA polymerase I [Candidatus Ratteibacteria bacterium]|nr:DNA polymerase I [Candidatus Ratteibacteria bacterium]
MHKEIYLIDGSALIYRSYYAIRDLRTSTGRPTNAVYGFTTTLLKLLKDRKPEYLCILYDLKIPTIRHISFADYKAQRKPMPEELVEQLPVIKEIAQLLGIRQIEKEGYEADDLIATLSERFSNEGDNVFIITGDKDIMQILKEGIVIVHPDGWRQFTLDDFRRQYGMEPSVVPDIIGLAGDSSDNIPGVYGIGEKTALKLLQRYGTIENLYSHIEEVEPERIRKLLIENKENAFMSKELAILKRDVDIGNITREDLIIAPPDTGKLLQMFEELEFRKIATQLEKVYPFFTKLSGISEDMIELSTGETLSIQDIVKDPLSFRHILEDPAIKKYGFNLKDIMVEVGKKGVSFESPAFDFSIARYLTGKVLNEENFRMMVRKYEVIFKEMGMEELFYSVEMPLVKTLAWMEINGIKTDRGILEQLSIELNNELKSFEDRIYKTAGEVFNINSSQQLASILFDKLKLPVQKKGKTGPSTDTSVLKELSLIHPLPGLILEYRELYKLKSTYIEGLLPFIEPSTGRIYPKFSQISTSTGRLSCNNPNLQNLPIRTERGSKIRKAFCCESGNTLYSFDYNQIELRVLAHLSGDPYLVDAFRNNRDIHTETANILFSGDTLFSLLSETGDQKDTRRIAKTINFGIIYGMSAYGLSQELGIPVSDADNFIKEYFYRFRGVKEYIDKTLAAVERDGFVSTILNRRRYIPEIRSTNKNQKEFAKRAAINMPVQGSAADLIKLAMNRIYELFKKRHLKSMMVLQIHDELLFEVLPSEEDIVVKDVKEIMEGVLKLNVPLKVDIKKGPNYLEME